MTNGNHGEDEGADDKTKGHNQQKDTTKTIITPLAYTYKIGSRHVFVASKG